MRDQHDRAGELEQALLEHLERRDVEVVGRLVEHEQVGGLQHERGDQHACLLAAREPADRHAELLGAEQKAPRPAGDVDRPLAEDDLIALRRQRAAQRQRRIELAAMLIEHGDAQSVGVFDAARRRAPARR